MRWDDIVGASNDPRILDNNMGYWTPYRDYVIAFDLINDQYLVRKLPDQRIAKVLSVEWRKHPPSYYTPQVLDRILEDAK